MQLNYFKPLLQRFSEKPESLPAHDYGFCVFLNYGYLVGLLAHFGFLITFTLLGKTSLAIFNIGSCLLFVGAIMVNLRGRLITSYVMGIVEVLAHAAMCVTILGWDSGFHFYILAIILSFFPAPLKMRNRVAAASVVILFYTIFYFYAHTVPPVSPLTPGLQSFFNIANILVFTISIAAALYGSMDALNRAEAKLAQAVEELKASQQETLVRNQELARKNEELIQLHQKADRIFSALAETLPGTVLDGKYRLDEKIGSGGFGAIYRATHLSMKRSVAIKVFRPSAGNDSFESLERFQLEAISACRVNHPNAVSVLDSGISSDGIAYLVMELLEGHSLTSELRGSQKLPPLRVAEIILPVCDVLAKAHSIGIIHRDIKPDNIFLHQTAKGEVIKVVDFGIAKLVDDTLSLNIRNLTGAGGILGTPTYMAPERFDFNSYDGKADVYSVGVVLYEMLCGQPPFESLDGGFFSIMRQHLGATPTPMRKLNSEVTDRLEAAVMKALEKDPLKRCTADELAVELAEALDIDLAQQLTSSQRGLLTLGDELTLSRNTESNKNVITASNKVEFTD